MAATNEPESRPDIHRPRQISGKKETLSPRHVREPMASELNRHASDAYHRHSNMWSDCEVLCSSQK